MRTPAPLHGTHTQQWRSFYRVWTACETSLATWVDLGATFFQEVSICLFGVCNVLQGICRHVLRRNAPYIQLPHIDTHDSRAERWMAGKNGSSPNESLCTFLHLLVALAQRVHAHLQTCILAGESVAWRSFGHGACWAKSKSHKASYCSVSSATA